MDGSAKGLATLSPWFRMIWPIIRTGTVLSLSWCTLVYFDIVVQPSWLISPPSLWAYLALVPVVKSTSDHPAMLIMVNSSGWGEGKCPSPGSRVIQAYIFLGHGHHFGWIQGDPLAGLDGHSLRSSCQVMLHAQPWSNLWSVPAERHRFPSFSQPFSARLPAAGSPPSERTARAMLQTSKYKSQIPTPPTGSVWSFQTVQTLILVGGFRFFSGLICPRNRDPKVVLCVLLILIITRITYCTSICVDQQIPSYCWPNPCF